MEDGQVLEKALHDETDLDVGLIGRDSSPDLSTVAVGLLMEVLIVVCPPEHCH